MKSKLFLLVTFLGVTPITLLFTIVLVCFLSYQKNPLSYYSHYANSDSVAYAALPTSDTQITDIIVAKEARIEIIRQFLKRYQSPLEPYAENIVKEADRYDLDHRLITAIAMQESNLCLKSPKDSHNCWGWGIYGGKVTRFSGYDEAIETITRTLSQKYKDKHGLVTPEEVVRLYTPSDDGKWVYAVNLFMDRLQ